ncbi:hypothetical protein C8R47DRAFT_1101732 [Mycena vitilis]|nr:hypothetical protein C8R47DRAFT_1101732 [Mycena vitilis]
MTQSCWKCGAGPPALLSGHQPETGLGPAPVSSTNVTHLLTSNHPALDSEIPILRDIISRGETQVDALDGQIDELRGQMRHLKSSLAELKQRKAEAAEDVSRHRSAISAVRRVPPELICEILIMALSPGRDKFRPPWWSGHICQSWRQAALGYTSFWSSISIPRSFWGKVNYLPRVQAQFIRAANSPLELRWSLECEAIDSELWQLVIPRCRRWRSLCFNVCPPHRRLRLDWLYAVRGHLHLLETLELNGASDIIIPDVFSDAPKLRQVFLSFAETPTPLWLPSVVIPWAQITHYRGFYSQKHQSEIIRNAPNLLYASIGCWNKSDLDTTQVLPHLRRLCIQEGGILRNITAPRVETLTVIQWEAYPDIIPFVNRSSCTLTKLVLLCCNINTELTDVLRHLSSLTHLLVSLDSYNAQIAFSEEMSAATDSHLCPNLTTLALGYQWPTPWDTLVSMVESRFRRQPAFSFLIFDAPCSKSDDLELMRAKGMDVGVLDRADSQGFTSSF